MLLLLLKQDTTSNINKSLILIVKSILLYSYAQFSLFFFSSANATPEFEGRGGEELANMISNMMQRAYHTSQAFRLKQLCILEGKQCWKLYIDILVSFIIY